MPLPVTEHCRFQSVSPMHTCIATTMYIRTLGWWFHPSDKINNEKFSIMKRNRYWLRASLKEDVPVLLEHKKVALCPLICGYNRKQCHSSVNVNEVYELKSRSPRFERPMHCNLSLFSLAECMPWRVLGRDNYDKHGNISAIRRTHSNAMPQKQNQTFQ